MLTKFSSFGRFSFRNVNTQFALSRPRLFCIVTHGRWRRDNWSAFLFASGTAGLALVASYQYDDNISKCEGKSTSDKIEGIVTCRNDVCFVVIDGPHCKGILKRIEAIENNMKNGKKDTKSVDVVLGAQWGETATLL